jgi:hypothetical protein
MLIIGISCISTTGDYSGALVKVKNNSTTCGELVNKKPVGTGLSYFFFYFFEFALMNRANSRPAVSYAFAI